MPCLAVFLGLLGFLAAMLALAWVSLATANRHAASRTLALEERLSEELGIPRDATAWAALYPPVADKDNAAPHYRKAIDALDDLVEKEALRERLDGAYPDFRYDTGPIDLEAVGEFLERNAEALAHTRRGARKPACRFPIDFEVGMLSDNGFFNAWSSLCWLLTYEAMHAAETGRPRAAMAALRQSLAITRHMAAAPLLEAQEHAAWSMQYAADALAFACGRRVFNVGQLTALSAHFAETSAAIHPRLGYVGAAAGVNVTLGRLHRGEVGIAEILGEEWAYDQALTSGRNPLLAAMYANTHRVSLESYAGMITAAALPPREQAQHLQTLERKLHAMSGQMHFAEFILHELPTRGHEFLLQTVTHQLVQAAIAIERHRITDGALPEHLQALESREFLTDPLGEGLLQFRHEESGFIVYSVAINGVDDGAPHLDHAWETQWRQGDWFFRVAYGEDERAP